MKRESRQETREGPLAWFAKNSVAANVFMVIILGTGLFMGKRVKQEVFPEVDLDAVAITIPYPGATPAEVEKGVILATEEAVRGLDGVDRVVSRAAEGFGTVTVEVAQGDDPDRVLADVESAVGRITSYPEDAERPTVSLATNRFRQVSLIVSGDLGETSLRALAEEMREELLRDPRLTVVELAGVREPEISIEVPPETLRRYGLTLDEISARVRAASVEVPGGVVRTEGGEILLRTAERRERARDFEDIVVVANRDGSRVQLGDMADIRDTFSETPREATFDGTLAVALEVFRVGDETPAEVSRAVEEYAKSKRGELPPGITLTTFLDNAEMYQDRRDLLVRNAMFGLMLVLLVLGLFLEMRLAFWVTLGIPISFIGALAFMPAAGASLNMISLFAFIVVLGMVVDDAIVVGESVFRRRQQGMKPLEAAIAGVREVAVPVTFAIVTTVVAFAPMLFLPGFMGDFFRLIPIVVIAVLLVSLFESLVILPAHLAHSKPPSQRGVFGWITRRQQWFTNAVQWLVEHTYLPTLRRALAHRYITLAVAVAVLVASVGLVAGGRIGFVFFPKVEGDLTVASLQLPQGAAVEQTRAARDKLVTSAQQAIAELGEPGDSRGIFAQLGSTTYAQGWQSGPNTGGHIAEVAVYLVPLSERSFNAAQFTQRWREKLGELSGIESLRFQYDTAGGGDAPFQLDLSHPDARVLNVAAADLASRLTDYDGVFDIDDGITAGKAQLDIRLKPGAERLGISELDIARQVRAAFFGAEALRLQRGRDELRVYVRLPSEQRSAEYYARTLLIRTPAGGEIPLSQVADIEPGRADTEINRRDGQRIASVSSDVDETVTNANEVMQSVLATHMPKLQAAHPGLTYSFGGVQQRQQETVGALGAYYGVAMLIIFSLLAVAFRSYLQPLIVMTAIPFGIVGALYGHLLMGFNLSIMSLLGLVALSGVVVNDSLILIVAINNYRREGYSLEDAILLGGRRRFRPILLTSLTTFFGLLPMITETSVQARFLVPMAISLAFGIMAATVLLLVVVPALYLALDDAKRAASLIWRFVRTGSRKEQEIEVAEDREEWAVAQILSTGEFAREHLESELARAEAEQGASASR